MLPQRANIGSIELAKPLPLRVAAIQAEILALVAAYRRVDDFAADAVLNFARVAL